MLCLQRERADIRSQFNSVLYQLLLDPSERVCFEAILCILGKHDSAERLESSLRSFSRPVLHAAARVVQEMGKSRAAAFSLGIILMKQCMSIHFLRLDSQDLDSTETSHPKSIRITSSLSTGLGGKDTIASLLASLMEVVRTTVACECDYVRAMVIKALIQIIKQLPRM
ncbi:unnamed protein product [Prunus armeniaca]|uniref:Uncharacterized protein n=1 Tax=Prunus armeniaca TaxID=36596 RepID=A0A6J5VET2_PRUAR|nr:unnamed protein product [Prunus armeniaca]